MSLCRVVFAYSGSLFCLKFKIKSEMFIFKLKIFYDNFEFKNEILTLKTIAIYIQ